MGRKKSKDNVVTGLFRAKYIAEKKGEQVIVAKAEAGFNFIIHDKLGELSDDDRYVKELRIIEWGKYEPKFDIRPWATFDSDGRQMGKGVTFSLNELIKLKEILDNMDLESFVMPDKKIKPEVL